VKFKIYLQRLLLIGGLVLAFVATATAQSRSGTYYRSDEYGRGDITFREVKRGKTKVLNFEISIAGATRGTCIGGLKGKAKWIDANVAEFNGDFNDRDLETGEAIGCRITFVFSGNRVILREDDCNDFHGVSCQFEGTFKRPSNLSKKKSR
jgi:hypothetical protein